jgi:hypothetical protein
MVACRRHGVVQLSQLAQWSWEGGDYGEGGQITWSAVQVSWEEIPPAADKI